MSTEQTPVKDSLTTESTTFDRELAKIGKVVLLQYTVESGNGPYTQSNLAIVRETNDANKFSALIVDDEDIDGPLAGYAYLNPPHDEDFTIVRMATPKECEAAGVEYIEPPIRWMPIETMPERTTVLMSDGVNIDMRRAYKECAIQEGYTHWQPLPKPPKDE